jgi:hypothetical protein
MIISISNVYKLFDKFSLNFISSWFFGPTDLTVEPPFQ